MKDDEVRKLLKRAERFISRTYWQHDPDEIFSDFLLRLAKQGDLPFETATDYWKARGHQLIRWVAKDYLRKQRAVRTLKFENMPFGYMDVIEEEHEPSKEFEPLREKLDRALSRISNYTEKQQEAFEARRQGSRLSDSETILATKVIKKVRRLCGVSTAG